MVKIWGRVALSVLFALAGLVVANVLPLPNTPLNQSRIIYAFLGAVVGFLIFSKVSTWIIKTATRLFRQLILRIASETINQFTNLASAGLHLLPSRGTNIKFSHPVILDTSAIIDGRVLDIAKAKFLSGVVLIPQFILTELQQVADSADSIKRARGRRGFEVIDQLKKLPNIKVEVWDRPLSGKTVDDQLIRLGKILKGRIFTCDFNLNRVATMSSIEVLNVNELANALRVVAIPGEVLQKVKIVHKGKDSSQGVGYLEDGTMIVLEDGEKLIGEQINVEVTRILQAQTGRMIFGKTVS